MERPIGEVIPGNTLAFFIKPYEIRTFKVTL